MGVFHQRVAALFSCQISGVGHFDIWNVDTAASIDVCHRPDCRKDPHMVPNNIGGPCHAWPDATPATCIWRPPPKQRSVFI